MKISSPKNLASPLKKNTLFLCHVKIILLMVVILLLFLPGMFNTTHEYSNHFSANTQESKIIPVSFFQYSLNDFNLGLFDMGHYGIDIEATCVLFFIVASFIVVELVFSIIRATNPIFTQKGKWQLILPILIFVLIIATALWFNFDKSNGLKIYEYTFEYTDDITGEVSIFTEEWAETTINELGEPERFNAKVIALKSWTNTVNLGYLFYIVIGLFIAILSIDFYTIISNSPHKNQENTEKTFAYQSEMTNEMNKKSNPPEPKSYNLDELKKLKELLDLGAITDEEFNEKKKELLGL